MTNPILISIEGNIGSGKTTLLKQLKAAHPDWFFVDEPVDQWLAMKNSSGQSLLELFYSDKRRWGYTFQNAALLTRVENLKKTLAKLPLPLCPGMRPSVVVMERSIETDAHVFARMLHNDGLIDSLEFDLYSKWFDVVGKDLPPMNGHIHLDTPVTVCQSRIKGRGREGEDAIPVEYLDQLDSYHFAWLWKPTATVPVLRYDTYSETPKGLSNVEDVEAWVERLWLESVE